METGHTPKVSVNIPTYNRGHFLGEAIQSVLDQTFTDFEIVVVDDGSTDNTREVVNSFKDHRIRYIYQENRGAPAASNTGLKASRGEYVTGLGSDDMYLPQNLELKVKMLDSRPEIALVCSDMYFFDNRTGANLGRYWHDELLNNCIDPRNAAQQPVKYMLSQGCFIIGQATLVRRLVFDDIGFFDESLGSGEDWDLFFRIVQRFPAIATIDIPLVRYRLHDKNLTLSWEKEYLRHVTLMDKVVRNNSLSGEYLKLVKKRLAPHHLRYGRRAIMAGRVSEGRKALLSYLKTKPWSILSYYYLGVSVLGTRGVQIFKSWKKWLTSYFVRNRTSGNGRTAGNQ